MAMQGPHPTLFDPTVTLTEISYLRWKRFPYVLYEFLKKNPFEI